LRVGQAQVLIWLEPALVAAALAGVLRRRSELEIPSVPLSPALRGGAEALLVELGRRLASDTTLDAEPEADSGPQPPTLDLRGVVLLEGRAFGYRVQASALDASGYRSPPPLMQLGDLPLELSLVSHASVAREGELAGLGPGDVWVPGAAPWQPSGEPQGEPPRRVVLAAPAAEFGLACTLVDEDHLVVGHDLVSLSPDPQHDAVTTEVAADSPAASVAQLAPVTVRVEIASVELTASEWAAVSPGDVLTLRRSPAEGVVLRVAGRPLARGRLVQVEGELGVQITDVLEIRP